MKTVEEIYREMMDRFSQETGMEPNGTGEMAVRMYALAAQVYGLYEELAWTCRQCFPQTATGEELEKHGFLRGIARNPARQASGTLRFSVQEAVEEDLEIAQGTVCMTAGLVAFETTQAGVLTKRNLGNSIFPRYKMLIFMPMARTLLSFPISSFVFRPISSRFPRRVSALLVPSPPAPDPPQPGYAGYPPGCGPLTGIPCPAGR